MTKAIPTVQKYMTTSPHFVGVDQPLKIAQKIMHDHHIRHLPVLEAGSLVGMITERDIALVETLRDVDPAKVNVGDAMSTSVYTARPETPLDEVCNEMAEKKYGSTVVMDNNKVVGIFTTVDVCRAFSQLLEGRLKN